MGRSWKYHGINDVRPGVPWMTKMGITMVNYHLENDGYITHLPSGNLLHSYSKITIEIVELPNLKMVIFQGYLSLPECIIKRKRTLKEIGKKTWQKWLGSRLLHVAGKSIHKIWETHRKISEHVGKSWKIHYKWRC